jgi:hypothetical protein
MANGSRVEETVDTGGIPAKLPLVLGAMGQLNTSFEVDKFKHGQHVYLKYHVGALTREPSITGLYSELPESVLRVDRWR